MAYLEHQTSSDSTIREASYAKSIVGLARKVLAIFLNRLTFSWLEFFYRIPRLLTSKKPSTEQPGENRQVCVS